MDSPTMNERELLEAELREAKEELVRKQREAQPGVHAPVAPPRPTTFRSVRLRSLDEDLLEEHVERLERDLADLEREGSGEAADD